MDYFNELSKFKDVKVSCIIAAYNEERRISAVLKVVENFPFFDEIIVVNDGSQDLTSEMVKKFDVELIEHPKNRGKAAAVLTGVKKSSGKLLVFIDAGLVGLTQENISKMMFLVLNGNYKMTILDRAGDRSAIWGWTNCARFFGGERCLWKKDFLKIGISKDNGYLMEIIMNLFYISNRMKIRNIYCDNLYTVHQYTKVGKVKGYWNYFKMSVKIVRRATIFGFFKQIKGIEDDHKYFREYRKLITRVSLNKYKNMKEKFKLLSRIKELNFRFNFDYQNWFDKVKVPNVSKLKAKGVKNYKKLKAKSNGLISSFSRLIKF
tara:strand:- start:583 stop:1542 length:960 start_codon:yes stop_codon:yes gene_type:complete